MPVVREIQLGKNGITENFIESLRNQFHNCNNVKVAVLSSFCRDKTELKNVETEILNKLGKNFTAKTIGYKINLKKWRQDKRVVETLINPNSSRIIGK